VVRGAVPVLASTSLIGLGSLGWALVAHDPHIFQRGGAALLVVGAGLIFWQLRLEGRLERTKHRGELLAESNSDLPSERVASEMSRQLGRRLILRATGDRVALVSLLAVVTALGEAIHGFGDLFVEMLLQAATC